MVCPGFMDNIGKAFVTGHIRSNVIFPCRCGEECPSIPYPGSSDYSDLYSEGSPIELSDVQDDDD